MKNLYRLSLISIIVLQTACVSMSGTGEQVRVSQPIPEPISPTADTYGFEEPVPGQVYQTPPPVYYPPQAQAQVEPLSPAVVALVSEADNYMQAGNLSAASANIERALAIQPRNALLNYKLAEIRLKQYQPQVTEELAQKSILLAGSDTNLKRQNWLLIAEARRLQQNYLGADEALMRARQLQ